MRKLWEIILLSGVMLLWGCVPGPYQRASGAYADAVAKSATAFTKEFETASDICHKRAAIDLTRHLIEGSASNIVNWAEHCQSVAGAEKLHHKGLQYLIAYGSALKTLAEGGTYDGADYDDAAGSIDAIATKVAGGTEEAKFATQMAPALKGLTQFLLVQYSSDEIKKAISASKKPVEEILKALDGYVQAVNTELYVYRRENANLLENARVLLNRGGPVRPVEALDYVERVTEMQRDIDRMLAQQNVYAQVLKELQKAQSDLEKAGQSEDKKDLQAVLSAMANVLTLLETLTEKE